MTQEIEFDGLNILLGVFISVRIVDFIIVSIYKIFPSLAIILLIVEAILFICILAIFYKELKIYAKV